MLSPSHILNIVHPNVISAYIKQDLEAASNGSQILVLETDINIQDGEEAEEKYFDLLADLQEIQLKAQTEYGHISRVDIRAHTYH